MTNNKPYHAYATDTQGKVYLTKYSNLAVATKESRDSLKEDDTLTRVTIYDYKHGKAPIEMVKKVSQ